MMGNGYHEKEADEGAEDHGEDDELISTQR
jgi:hypothetical protein